MIILMNVYLVIGTIFGTIEMLGEYVTGMESGYLFRALYVTILWPTYIPYIIKGIRNARRQLKGKDK